MAYKDKKENQKLIGPPPKIQLDGSFRLLNV